MTPSDGKILAQNAADLPPMMAEEEITQRLNIVKKRRSYWVTHSLKPMVFDLSTIFDGNGNTESDKALLYSRMKFLVCGSENKPESGLMWALANDEQAVYKVASETLFFKTCPLSDKEVELSKIIRLYHNSEAVVFTPRPSADGTIVDPLAMGGGRKEDFLKLEDLEAELIHRGAEVRLNTLTQDIVISGFDSNTLDDVVTELHSDLCDKYKGCGFDVISAYLATIARRNSFNPALDTVLAAEPDGSVLNTLYILMGIVGDDFDSAFSRLLLEKWLRMVCSLMVNPDEKPQAPDGMLVLVGPPGIGKSSLLRHFALDKYFFDTPGTTPITWMSADNKRRVYTSLITEIPECDRTLRKREMSDILKGEITSADVVYRRPYGRNDVKMAKHTSLAGTSNTAAFLSDDTGNRKFWCITLDKEMQYSEIIDLDIAGLYHYLLDNPLPFRLTPKERAILDRRNNRLLAPVEYQSEVEDYLTIVQGSNAAIQIKAMTITEFKRDYLKIPNADNRKLSAALKVAGLEGRKTKQGMVYDIPIAKTIVPPMDWNATISDDGTESPHHN